MSLHHSWLILLSFAVLSMGASPNASAADAAQKSPDKLRVYLGTYTRGAASQGIYLSELDLKNGRLSSPELAVELVNPTFLAIHPTHKYMYAVGEIADFDGKKTGGVSSLEIDKASGKLRLLNQQSSGGAGPCHLVVDGAGRNVLVANYGGGSVACLPLNEDGKLREASAFVQNKGKSANPSRQEAAHAHSIHVDPTQHFVIAADLGLDQLLVFKFDSAKGSLVANDPAYTASKPGAGPRHFAFHPNKRYAYSNGELDSTVTAYEYDADRGVLTPLGSLSTLPADFKEENTTAEVVVHPSGKFVYVSNRGHNSIAIFEVDPATGKLTAQGHQSTGGKTPRNFNIDPTGQYLLAANQDSGNVVVMRVDPTRGKLAPTGSEIQVPMPVCVKFMAFE